MAQQTTNKPLRETAQLASIKELLDGKYVVQEGWLPNYIHTNGRKLTRVNILGIVIEKPTPFNFFLDDGTGSILVTDFTQLPQTRTLKVGEPVLVIGKPRQGKEELFIASEVVQHKQIKQNPGWLVHRKKELKKIYESISQEGISTKTTLATKEKYAPEKNPDTVPLSGEDLLEFIKSKDGGDGCATEEVIEYFGSSAEEHINTLLTMGEIFEIRPGYVKVLE